MEDTKLKGDIAEHKVVLHALQNGWGVSIPVGDRLPYDLILDISGNIVKIQVKNAWFDAGKCNYVVDNRRTKTNRRNMVRSPYRAEDFDFAILCIDEINVFYVMPSKVFISYGSEIHLVETDKRQRKPKSAKYRNAWKMIEQWAVSEEIPE